MYRLNVEIDKNNKVSMGEYIVKDKHLDMILKFCERNKYKVIGIKKV